MGLDNSTFAPEGDSRYTPQEEKSGQEGRGLNKEAEGRARKAKVRSKARTVHPAFFARQSALFIP